MVLQLLKNKNTNKVYIPYERGQGFRNPCRTRAVTVVPEPTLRSPGIPEHIIQGIFVKAGVVLAVWCSYLMNLTVYLS